MKTRKNRFVDVLLNIIVVIAVMLFAVSFSAFIPCYFKGFYTPWVNWLDIPTTSGYSVDKILYAYSNVLDFIWRGAEFNPGIPMTESGIDHFRDCIPLFWMQLWFMLGSFIYLVVYFVLLSLDKIKPIKWGKLPLYAYGGIFLIGLLAVLGIWAAISFDSLFTVFHTVFFPGKENWVFDPRYDKLILILPEQYFLVCAVFIISLAVIISVLFILLGCFSNKIFKKKPTSEVQDV